MLELRAHKDRASTALAAAQQQITDLTRALTEAREVPDKSQMASTLEVCLSALEVSASGIMHYQIFVKCGITCRVRVRAQHCTRSA